MAEIRKYAMSNKPPDIPQILLEAQNRWLRPTEICQILSNYKKFSIAPEPPNRPQSGSLFLFDRKILRYFRKDGHNWRKKKDGKTVKEAHEKLKVGSVDVLHCYYAHGEENENFQRRTYWLLEEGFMNIVLVHYLEIKAENDGYTDQSVRYPLLKQSSSDLLKMEPGGLKKSDSFSKWMSDEELPEVADLDIKSSSDAFWSTTESVNVAEGSSIPINEQLYAFVAFVVSPSLSQDQLFSIIDVSPSWAYNGTKTKVSITGTFLAKKDVENCRWSCMFGDTEVSAEVLVDGSLRCYTPVHHSGRDPF